MVYLGVGIVIVSLSVAIYKYKILATWAEKEPKDAINVHPRTDYGKEAKEEQSAPETPSISVVKPKSGDEILFAPVAKQNGLPTVEPITDFNVKRVIQEQPVQKVERPTMPPPPHPDDSAKRKPERAPTSLMPPPSRPMPSHPTFKTPSKPSTVLRPPPSTASTLRAPPSRSLAPPSSTLAPSTSTLAPSSRPSKKVILDPGHSPLDWAHLIAHPPSSTFLRGEDVPVNLIRVPPSLVKYHSGRKRRNAWGVWQGKVYNLTPYMRFHPGGVDQLMRGAGKEKEGERLFNEVHPWVSWENMLGECLIGILVSENEAEQGPSGNQMDEMD